jgi:hypothetical protein
MYVEECMTISKIENGYLVEVRRPYEDTTILNGKELVPLEKRQTRFFVPDVDAVGKKVSELLPLLVDKLEPDEEFANAFKEMEE